MTLLLGVDTGGTYTDAVLLRDETEVVATAKSLTMRHDLALGIGAAVHAVLEQSGVRPSDIAMAALSTTLATNALVEGQGGRVALIYVGFGANDLSRHGLEAALKGDPVLCIAGGHTHAGGQAEPIDTKALEAFLKEQTNAVSGYAIAARFATRNPSHELDVARRVSAVTNAPVTCSHQLSAKLNGPKRAVTAVLNARLIGMIDGLIGQTQDVLTQIGIAAPLMVVRGDGALMSAAQARVRPIETILSGPAASIVGARWLTGAATALVSDIGGTTTDVAVLRDGRPSIDPQGAQVGGYRTMVEAVAMRTTGLGGDSQVHVREEGLRGGLTLGPRRILPVALAATEDPETVHTALDMALRSATPNEHDGRFVRAVPGVPKDGLKPRETALLDRIGQGLLPLAQVLRNRMDHASLSRLLELGAVQVAGATPSDASHVMRTLDTWDASAAHKALTLLARKRTGSGDVLASSAEDVAGMIVQQLTDQTVTALLETVFEEEEGEFGGSAETLARHDLMHAALDGHRGLMRLSAGLDIPVVGLGASAATYYPAVGERLGARMLLPEYAGVANAIGAVVGRVIVRRSGTITSPSEGQYRAHLDSGPEDFAEEQTALSALERTLRDQAGQAAGSAGAEDIEYSVERSRRTARTEAREVFVEATITVEASGRPRVALGQAEA